jgi:hypothetical protein
MNLHIFLLTSNTPPRNVPVDDFSLTESQHRFTLCLFFIFQLKICLLQVNFDVQKS